MSPFLAELVGTLLLMLFGCGIVAGVVLEGTKSHAAGWLPITVTWGLAVAVPIYAVGGASGAHLNPAVTLGLAAIGEFPWDRVPGYIAAQMLGAVAGAGLVWLQYLPHWKQTPDPALLLVAFTPPASSRNRWHSVLSEIVGTAVLMMGLLAIGANHFADGLNPLVIGGLVTLIGLSLGGTTGFPINPARSLGPRIAHALLPIPGKGSSDFAYGWLPVAGELVGGVFGAFLYLALFRGTALVGLWVTGAAVAAVAAAAIVRDRAPALQVARSAGERAA